MEETLDLEGGEHGLPFSEVNVVTGHVYAQYSLGVPYVFPIREHLVRFGQV